MGIDFSLFRPMDGIKRTALAGAITLGLLFGGPAANAGYDEGAAAYQKKDYETALLEWEPIAEGGFAAAQYGLGILYQRGWGVERDINHAMEWFEKAAAQDYTRSLYRLGQLYRTGREIPRDYAKALDFYQRAAELEYDPAMYALGRAYRNGRMVPKNLQTAFEWYEKAAAGEYSSGLYGLARAYERGEGTEKDLAKAIILYLHASAKGSKGARKRVPILTMKHPEMVAEAKEARARQLTEAREQAAAAKVEAAKKRRETAEKAREKRIASQRKRWAGKYKLRESDTKSFSPLKGSDLLIPGDDKWVRVDPKSVVGGEAVSIQGHWNPETRHNAYALRSQVKGRRTHVLLVTEMRRVLSLTPLPVLQSGVSYAYRNCSRGQKIDAYPTTVAGRNIWLARFGCEKFGAGGQSIFLAASFIEGPRKFYFVRRIWVGRGVSGNQISDMMRYFNPLQEWVANARAPVKKSGRRIVKKSSGTGFFVSNAGHILTNHHVVDGCRQIKIPKFGSARRVNVDDVADLAIVQLAENRGAKSAIFRNETVPQLGESVVTAGFPLAGVDINITTGIVSALAGPDKARDKEIQISAPIQPGSSGGPVLDVSGNVIGVVVAGIDHIKVENVGFAIKAKIAREFLAANGIAASVPDNRAKLDVAEIASRAKSFTVPIECWN